MVENALLLEIKAVVVKLKLYMMSLGLIHHLQ